MKRSEIEDLSERSKAANEVGVETSVYIVLVYVNYDVMMCLAFVVSRV